MDYKVEVKRIDEKRQNGELDWEEYGILVSSKFREARAWDRVLALFAKGIRDRSARLRRLQDPFSPEAKTPVDDHEL